MPKPRWLFDEMAPDDPRVASLAGSKGYAHGAKTWVPSEDLLHAAQDDATRVAVIDQMGIDIISDGEQLRVN